MRIASFLPALLLVAGGLSAQTLPDRSFLLEEAHPATEHAIAHDLSAVDQEWSYVFSQEWSLRESRHHISYALPLIASSFGGAELGDVSISYRYQHTPAEHFSVAPRLSVTLPTGTGEAPVWQLNIPLTLAHGDRVVTHWNLGTSYTKGDESTGRDITAGSGVVVGVSRRSAAVFELLATRDLRRDSTAVTVSPGLRYEIPLRGELSVVPGVALPVTFTEGTRSNGVMLHVTFSHPLFGF